MRITEKDKARNRERIVEAAGHLFRERGVDAVGVAEVMSAAGFTHGGFYNHFESKEALAAEVCASGIGRSNGALATELANAAPGERWRRSVTAYLSTAHRDAPASGCTVAALLTDVPRHTVEVQRAFTDGTRDLVELVTSHVQREQGLSPAAARRRALQMWSEMLGALTLSRAVVATDRKLADEILSAALQQILG